MVVCDDGFCCGEAGKIQTHRRAVVSTDRIAVKPKSFTLWNTHTFGYFDTLLRQPQIHYILHIYVFVSTTSRSVAQFASSYGSNTVAACVLGFGSISHLKRRFTRLISFSCRFYHILRIWNAVDFASRVKTGHTSAHDAYPNSRESNASHTSQP